MDRIGICTLFTGYNFGSALQCYASKRIIEKIGYKSVVFKLKGSLIEGRDVRVKKLIILAIRSVIHLKEANRIRRSYQSSFDKTISETSKSYFLDFYKDKINPHYVSYKRLKEIARKKEYTAFICGSDQIWDPTDLYLDPFYYLEFAPSAKRIAFAPSLGKDFVPEYNRKAITKKIKGICFLSSREKTGKKIIETLVGRKCEELIDPTLVLKKSEWINYLDLKEMKESKYVLAYFLDTPSDLAIKRINDYSRTNNVPVYYIPYINKEINNWKYQDCGPIQFLNLILNADVVFTDSFHGLVFSLNFEKEVYAFSRNYGSSLNQSTRLISVLESLDLLCRYDSKIMQAPIKYPIVNERLNALRSKSLKYISVCISEVEKRT